MTDYLKKKFSADLKSTREEIGISLEQIAAKTRIDIKFLRAIEDGNFDVIDEIYIRAFIREYSQMLNLNGNEVLGKYDSIKKGINADLKITDTEKKDDTQAQKVKEFDTDSGIDSSNILTESSKLSKSILSTPKKKIIVYGGAVTVILIFFVLFLLGVFNSSGNEIVTEQNFEEVIKDQTERYGAAEDNKPRYGSSSDSLVLKIIARDSSWISVNSDDIVTQEFMMYRGRTKTVKAMEKFRLTIGNAGGVKFLLNNDTLDFAGKSGQVRSLLIDETGLNVITNVVNE